MSSRPLLVSALLLSACVSTRTAAPPTSLAPRVDYHQHLVSAAFAPIVKLPQRDGRALLAELDAAGVEKAVVLSVGYSFADERKNLPDPDRLTREENDWTSAQVRRPVKAPVAVTVSSSLPTGTESASVSRVS